MAQVTLHYFDGYGRAEPIRLLLKHAGVEFVDHRMTHEQWDAYKQTGAAEFGQLPILEMDGHYLVQTGSILRYLCTKYNFVSGDVYEDYLADSACELLNDIITEYVKAMGAHTLEEFKNSYMPGKLQILQKRFVEHGGQFFVGNHLTIADFRVFEFVHDNFLRASKREAELPGLTLVAPRLIEYAESFLKQFTHLQTYLQARPELPY